MAPRIRLLSEHTINQIAAGEVIADPASVVKELLDNSLDAGSLDIHIEIVSGGRSLIRVTDNGCGMLLDDALLCWERYATSKLRTFEDFSHLHTMGFRGEALSSIASIAKCSLLTATEETESGTRVEVEGGKILSSRKSPRSRGTTLEVRDLFYNVPVRRKFQKSPKVDSLAIHRIVIELALAHPHVRFCLVDDQKTVLLAPAIAHLPPLEALKERATELLGDIFGSNMQLIDLPLLDDIPGYHVKGILAAPIDSKPTKASQYILMNQRCVDVPFLKLAVKEGYGTALAQGRYPAFLLHFTLPPEAIDVNVHPQKKEVRLRHEMRLGKALTAAVSEMLYGTSPPSYAPPSSFSLWKEEQSPLSSPSFTCAEEPVEWILHEEKNDFAVNWDSPAAFNPVVQKAFQEPLQKEVQERLSLPAPKSPPRVLATFPGYLLLDPNSPHFSHHPRSIWLLDQRAAHLRLIHEQLQGQTKLDYLESQILLLPSVLDLSLLQMQRFLAQEELFTRSGWQIEPLGPTTLTIRCVPQAFFGLKYDDLFFELLDAAEESREVQLSAPSSFTKKLAQKSLSMQKELNLEEATLLVNTLFSCQEPMKSLSGRPTCLFLDLADFSTLFRGANV